MTDLVLDDLDPGLVARLEVRARSYDRTLEEEVRAILEGAALRPSEEALRIAREWQQRLAGRVTGDSAELIREDRER